MAGGEAGATGREVFLVQSVRVADRDGLLVVGLVDHADDRRLSVRRRDYLATLMLHHLPHFR